MKRFLPLIIINGVSISLYASFCFVVGLIGIIQGLQSYSGLYVFVLLEYLSTLFLLASTDLMAFFVKKNNIYIVPVGVFIIFGWGLSLARFLSYSLSWITIVEFIFLSGILVITIIEFILLKPFSNSNNQKSVRNKNEKPLSLEDIAKAKELLDSGAINKEEFLEIKHRALK